MTTSVPKRALREPRLRDLENRFAAVTHDRLRRAFDTLLPRQQDVVAMIPLLFHLNHALLPGYCGADTPYGRADYTPTRPALAATRRVLKSFTHESRVLREFGILAGKIKAGKIRLSANSGECAIVLTPAS